MPPRTVPRRALDRLREPRVATAWLALLAWIGVVWWLGTSGFGSAGTSRYLVPFLRWLFPEMRLVEVFALAGWIRNAMHPAIYGVLAGLAFHALRVSGVSSASRAAALAGALSLAVALGDEARQALLAARTGSLFDVALDAVGASVALALALLLVVRRRAPPPLP